MLRSTARFRYRITRSGWPVTHWRPPFSLSSNRVHSVQQTHSESVRFVDEQHSQRHHSSADCALRPRVEETRTVLSTVSSASLDVESESDRSSHSSYIGWNANGTMPWFDAMLNSRFRDKYWEIRFVYQSQGVWRQWRLQSVWRHGFMLIR